MLRQPLFTIDNFFNSIFPRTFDADICGTATMNALFYASSVLAGSLVAAAPLCNNVTNVARGGLPNIEKPPFISASAAKGFQLALFLENLEASFFQAGLSNITEWSHNGYANDTIEVVTEVAAVSRLAMKCASAKLT